MVRPIRKKKSNIVRYLPFIILIFFTSLVGFAFYSINNEENLDNQGYAATPVSNRILWNGANWYLHGVNVPWYNWGCDFGCNATVGKSGGVSTNLTVLNDGFTKVKKAGMHSVRWWLFPGDPWQITRDQNGVATGIHPAVYTDIDAALALAEKYDLYYNFVLFSEPASVPRSWQTDPVQRARLVEALGSLFSHYKSNNRIMSWEIYNEPENDIWNNKIDQKSVVDTGTAIAKSVHENSPGTLVTVGSLFADGMKMWLNAGLDFYSPHWYDYMANGDYCMICNTYSHYESWGVNKPIVVGEFYTATPTTSPYSSMYRYEYWYNNGYAGAWSWSLFAERTGDKLITDLETAKSFASKRLDIGPLGAGPLPTLGITITPTQVVPTSVPTQISVTKTPTTRPSSTPTSVPTKVPTTRPSITPTPTKSVENFRISSVTKTNITASKATIKWLTDRPTTSRVMYGTSRTSITTSIPLKTARVTNHGVTLSNLKKNTRYYFRVYSRNSVGLEKVSGIQSFKTKSR